ncbi:MAG: tetratricopeptide repeat protein [Rhizomicrobium sp.]|jgi:tetratricopeptide (TPR) repeat protein
MLSNSMRAAAAVLLLTTAGVGATVVATTVSAEAAARPQVGNLLNQAISLAKEGNINAAEEKLRAAEGVGGLTAGDNQAIAQVRSYVEAKNSTGPLTKFADDYTAGRYGAVVGQDADELRKSGHYGYDQQIVVAQAYYLMGRCEQSIPMLKDLSSGAHASEQVLSVLYSAAYKCQDNDAMRSALERLVQSYNKPQYWSDLLQTAEGSKGLKDHQLLDIYRLRVLTNSLKTADDYETSAELAIEFKSSTEAQTIVQKGLDAKVLSGARDQRLLATAKAQAASDAAGLPRTVAAANSAKTGDLLVTLGETYWGMGRYQDAVNAIQAGLKKGVTDTDDAQLRLGMAYFGAGQKADALAAFNAVSKGNANDAMIAHIWTLYIRTH